jgi:hypothetical protein
LRQIHHSLLSNLKLSGRCSSPTPPLLALALDGIRATGIGLSGLPGSREPGPGTAPWRGRTWSGRRRPAQCASGGRLPIAAMQRGANVGKSRDRPLMNRLMEPPPRCPIVLRPGRRTGSK